MNKWLKRYAPVGMDVSGELGIMIMLLFFESGLRILQFKGTLWEDVLRACYRVHNEEAYELIEGSSMPDYLPMLRNCYNPPYVFLGVMIIIAVYNYFYHYSEGKSIYLMRRLPNKWELFERCTGVPLLGIMCVEIVIFFILPLCCYPIYQMVELPQIYEVKQLF